MKHKLTDKLKTLVRNTPDRYAVHVQCKPILEEMSDSQEFLYDIIRYNLSNPDFLQRKRTYPTLSLNIMDTADFTLVVNIFPPLPDKRTDISFQSVHHHGSLLLSTVGIIGPGYKSILFKKGFIINEKTRETDMKILKEYQNKLGQVEFVDSHQPHIVFYPEEISATYAFWCNEKKQVKDAIKKVDFLKRIRKPAAQLINKLGLSKVFGLNKIEYFDFYTENGKLIAMKERLAYSEAGDNDNFLRNIFYFIQQAGFNDIPFLASLTQSAHVPEQAKRYISMLINKEIIEACFYYGHLNIPKVNLLHQDLIKVVKNAQTTI